MDLQALTTTIDEAFEQRDTISTATTGDVRDAVETALEMLDRGELRVAEKADGEWTVNQWLKKAVLLSFRLRDMEPISGGPGDSTWVGQGRQQVQGMGRKPVYRCRIPRRSALHRPEVGIHRTRCGSHAEFRESRSLC